MTITGHILDPLSGEYCWQNLANKAAEGKFIYAVLTTGIYCRPGCPSRRPNRGNLRFFKDANGAEQAGVRPCRRCCPQNTDGTELITARVTGLCRYIETCVQAPTLNELANYAGISAYHLQRQFKSITGLSPKAYAKSCRQQIPNFPRKRNGFTMTIYSMLMNCSLGKLLVAATEKGLCAILIGDDEHLLEADLHRRFPNATIQTDEHFFSPYVPQLIALIEEPNQAINLPLDIRGTLFQEKVWQALRQIPVGETRSYTEIATAIGSPRAVRAVAGACAANALAIAIPCHRVVRNDGNLSGYRWGPERKKILLQRENDCKK